VAATGVLVDGFGQHKDLKDDEDDDDDGRGHQDGDHPHLAINQATVQYSHCLSQ